MPAGATVDVWELELTADPTAVHDATSLLSPDERRRAERLRFATDRRRFVVAHSVTRREATAKALDDRLCVERSREVHVYQLALGLSYVGALASPLPLAPARRFGASLPLSARPPSERMVELG